MAVLLQLYQENFFLHGRYDSNLTVMMGHNTDEASEFTSPYINTTETFKQNVLQVSFPNINGYNTASYVMDTLYPPIYDGSHGYESNFTRATSLVSDALFQCNANYLARAFGGLDTRTSSLSTLRATEMTLHILSMKGLLILLRTTLSH